EVSSGSRWRASWRYPPCPRRSVPCSAACWWVPERCWVHCSDRARTPSLDAGRQRPVALSRRCNGSLLSPPVPLSPDDHVHCPDPAARGTVRGGDQRELDEEEGNHDRVPLSDARQRLRGYRDGRGTRGDVRENSREVIGR